MSQIPGTNVAAMVVPFDDQDIYATHNDKYGRGGFRVCANIAERDAITDLRRKEGMWVKVLDTNLVYELSGGITNAHWSLVSYGATTASPVILQLISNTWVEVDTHLASDTGTATWKIQVDDAAQNARVVFFVSSVHNGIDGVDPVDIQWSVFGKLRFGSLLVESTAALEDSAFGKIVSLRLRAGSASKVTVWRMQGLWY